MLKLYENIKNQRIKNGMTQAELAQRMGYADKSMIAKIEKGLIDITRSKIEAFAKVFHITPGQLMGDVEGEQLADIKALSLKRLPVLGEIACGKPKYTNEERESYILAGTDIKADFCLIAKGDSMINARICDGDVVFIRKQDIVDNGDITAVVINNEATLKRFFYYREKSLLVLKAENSAYDDLVFQDEELDNVYILGKAIAFQSDVK